MLKITAFFMITLLAWLYMMVGILLTCGKQLHNYINLIRREAQVIKLAQSRYFLFKCLYQARKVSVHVLCAKCIYISSFYDCFIGFWKCGIFLPFILLHLYYSHQIVWQLDLQLPIQSVPIPTHVVSSSTQYNIML